MTNLVHKYEAHGGVTGQPPDPDMLPSEHAAGCVYGGFSCRYWMIADGCPEEHWEVHYTVGAEKCPCGTRFPGAGQARVVFDATSDDD